MGYTPEQLCDVEAIKDVAKRYSQGVDRLDLEKLKSAYWPDGTDEHGSFKGNAHQFAEFCMTGHAKWRSTSHCIFNHSIESERRRVSCYRRGIQCELSFSERCSSLGYMAWPLPRRIWKREATNGESCTVFVSMKGQNPNLLHQWKLILAAFVRAQVTETHEQETES